MTSAEEDAESVDGDSQRGSIERQSPQLDVDDIADDVSQAQHEVASAGEVTGRRPEPTTTTTTTEDGESSPDLDMLAACSPNSAAVSEDSREPTDGWRPTVGSSPPPLPSPPPVTAGAAAAVEDDDEATADLVITDVAKYVSNISRLI